MEKPQPEARPPEAAPQVTPQPHEVAVMAVLSATFDQITTQSENLFSIIRRLLSENTALREETEALKEALLKGDPV